ncbi:hypothetical protein SAMN02745664_12516 [Moraxella cuniculi DSM 21768]|uniref:Filamentous hemagglutinin n=1 Tax=Moraxella cuniculi DSM 21768 TaxID=1122245 RepID=A0A1N7G8S6_9GAMM|nr:hypothetical protein [Moraxella cuniculi]OOS02662.1 hypothetical protein B0189_10005 [Moraxella cuniculi]SIS08761.1 hypothetical protein SAMN02745664_1256 [Moraxella cuniculi DSM 21768]SIS08846.1 hypothetical protein SAMN02745664_12516 [Moraxella cuniculi DSM 21768]
MKTKKIYLVILFCLPFNSYAGALKNTDIITDQTSIVTQRERAQAGQLKSSGGWEVKQTAYNTKTGNIEVVAQKGDKYAHVAVSTVSDKSFLQRVGGFFI